MVRTDCRETKIRTQIGFGLDRQIDRGQMFVKTDWRKRLEDNEVRVEKKNEATDLRLNGQRE